MTNYKNYEISSIEFPPLGCGNGGLTWKVVGPIMYNKLCKLPINIEIYAPFGTNPNEISIDFLTSNLNEDEVSGKKQMRVNPKWYLILQVVRELNQREYALNVGRTIFQKICYVLTRNGVNTGFVFTKGEYGPFSTQVKDSITVLANANLIVEKQLGRMICFNVPDDVTIDREKFSEEEWKAVKKTVDLFGRIKRTEQAEMMATVLYSYDELQKRQEKISDKNVYDFILDWKPHWKSDKEYEICDTIHNLAMLSQMHISHSQQLMDTDTMVL